MNYAWSLLYVCPLLFMAGLIDGISGGGGIISLPAYLLTGMPLSAAYGCNKMQSLLGTSASLLKYAHNGLLDVRPSVVACIPALVGSFVSTRIMLALDENIKKIIVGGAMCFIIILTILARKMKFERHDKSKLAPTMQNTVRCLACGLILGFYDGFFGPGGGTIALMLFSIVLGYDMRVATGNGKLIIVASNLISLVHYIAAGSIIYLVAVPASVSNIIGSYLGAHLAVKNGQKLVKRVMYLVVIFLIVQAIVKLI